MFHIFRMPLISLEPCVRYHLPSIKWCIKRLAPSTKRSLSMPELEARPGSVPSIVRQNYHGNTFRTVDDTLYLYFLTQLTGRLPSELPPHIGF